MAEPIGIASGLLALTVFAFQSSVSLCQVVDSFQTNKKVIRELKDELQALNGVLRSLQLAAAENNEHLSALNLPLFCCGKACKGFEAVIGKCTAHSGGSRTSFRDWAKLQYLGNDIIGFKDMLAGYKSTINIALAEANLRTVAVTATVLKEYKELITNTTTDLEDHLKEIDAKLQALSPQESILSGENIAERERVQEERDSTKQCLTICAQVSGHINQVQPLAFEDISAAQQIVVGRLRGLISAKKITADVLNECKERLVGTTSDLERHLREIENRLRSLPSQGVSMSGEDLAERKRVQEEKESTEQCLSICAEASQQVKEPRTNVFGDVSAGEDSHQVIVATLGDLVSAKRVSTGNRGIQWLGQMSDASLQQLSKARRVENPDSAATEQAIEPGNELVAKFEGSYGAGYKLE